jgi:hypothetical protein
MYLNTLEHYSEYSKHEQQEYMNTPLNKSLNYYKKCFMKNAP